MSQNMVVATWTGLITALQQQVDAADAADSASRAAVTAGLNSITYAPPLPHAAWKTLVQDVQVCYHVLQVWLKQGSASTASVPAHCRTPPAGQVQHGAGRMHQHALNNSIHAHEQHHS